MHARRLTVSSSHPESRATCPRDLPIAPMPFLRLRGRWLDQAGFAIGTNVRVEVSTGRSWWKSSTLYKSSAEQAAYAAHPGR